MPQANTETMNGQLSSLGAQLPADVHAVLVLDGAGWHHSTRLEVPDNLSLVHLPPAAPELNPVELVWHELRQRYLSNRVYPNSTQLEDAVGDAWNRFADDLPRVQSLTDYPWIRAARQTAPTKGI